jgi:hypothetical protein
LHVFFPTVSQFGLYINSRARRELWNLPFRFVYFFFDILINLWT